MKKVTVIGAGIGGLTTAIALKRKGFEVEIFETTPEFKKAGSGINLAMNAMQVYKRLGVYDDIIQQANYTNTMNSTNINLKVLGGVKFKNLESVYGVKNVAIHRATLHEILVKHTAGIPIHLNKKLKSISQRSGSVMLSFEDGTTHEAEVVIGADGIHSTVRKSIFEGTELRDANQACWRGISNATIGSRCKTDLNEAWGKGNRFGFVHITDKQVYWYALIDKDKYSSKSQDLRTDLLKNFSEYNPTVQEIIRETPKEAILFNEIWDLKPIDQWYKGNVCLIGDAAHATTPNMGQGAVQAIESAMALSICLSEENSIEEAFKKYQEIRFKKANYIVKTSWKIGKLAQSSNSFTVGLRNFVLPLIPSFVTENQNKKIFTLNY